MNKRELNFYPEELRYTGIIGTGGLGSGNIFLLSGNHTLGREESRGGHFLEIRDYCKQHIILHYIRILLGNHILVIPVGKVGNDENGKKILGEMEQTGFEMNHIGIENNASTLYSFCFYYPDGSGGNLTTDNSASAAVDTAFVELAKPEMTKLGISGIAMAAPEVPLTSRICLLQNGRESGLFTASSFTTGEALKEEMLAVIDNSDLIAINLEEAAAFAGISGRGLEKIHIVEKGIDALLKRNSDMFVTVTAGGYGSWCWDGTSLHYFAAVRTNVLSTAGAGDAFFSGILTGMALGLELYESQQLATLVASHSVSSPDTINRMTDRDSLRRLAAESEIDFCKKIFKLLED